MNRSLASNVVLVSLFVLALLVSSANFSPPIDAATSFPPATVFSPSQPTAKRLAPGVHRIYGTVTRVQKRKLRVKTQRANIATPVTAKKLNLLGKPDASLRDVRKGDLVDGFIRVKPNGKIKTIRVRVLQPEIDGLNVVETNSAGAEAANAQWSAPEDLASDMGEAHSASMVRDGQNNLYGVWYATSPTPGLYLRTRGSGGWTSPQLIFSTDWASMPSLGIDGQGTLHLVWTDSYDEQYTRIYYAQGIFNETTLLYEWTQPTDISELSSSGYTNFVYSADLAVTGGATPTVHVVWSQQWCPPVGPCTDRLIYRGWRSGEGWAARIILAESNRFIMYPVIAADSAGRVGVGYAKQYVCACYDAHIYYRECAAGDCRNITFWTVPLEVSTATSLAPDLAFDALGNAHFVWQGYLNGNKSVFYSMRVGGAPTWTTAESLATLPYDNNMPIVPRVAASSLNNRYVVWCDCVSNYEAPQVFYRQWNGTGWAAAATLGDSPSGWLEDWAALLIDENNHAHLLWNGLDWRVFYSTTGIAGTSAPLISIQVTDSANNIVTSFDTNDEGWYEQNPITVTVTVTNPNANAMNAPLQINFGSSNNKTRFYVWAEEPSSNCRGTPTPYDGTSRSHIRYTISCLAQMSPSETRSLKWGLWLQPSSLGQLDLTAQLGAEGEVIAQDQKSLTHPSAQIHPFVLVPGYGAFNQFATDRYYESLLETLQKMGYETSKTLFSFGYNPLPSAVTNASSLAVQMSAWQLLAQSVEWVRHEQSGKTSFDLFGHSFGVPIVRSYVQLTPNNQYEPVHRLLLVGGTNKGILDAYNAREGLQSDAPPFNDLLGAPLMGASIFCGNFTFQISTDFPPEVTAQVTDEDRYKTLHQTKCGMLSIPEALPVPNGSDPVYLKDTNAVVYPFHRQHNPLLEGTVSSPQDDPWWLPDNPSPGTSFYDLNGHVQSDLLNRGIPMSNVHIFYNDNLPTNETHTVDAPFPLLWRNGHRVESVVGAGDNSVTTYSAIASDLWQGQATPHRLYFEESPGQDTRQERHINLALYPESQQEIGWTLSGTKPPFSTPLKDINIIAGERNRAVFAIYGAGPIDLLVVDPLGRKLGYDAVRGQILNEIPTGVYTHQPGQLTEVVIFGPLQDNYTIQTIGLDAGNYTVLPLYSDSNATVPLAYKTGAVRNGDAETTSVRVPNRSEDVPYPPEVQAGADISVVTRTPITFSGSFKDINPNDTHTILWNFGDGTVATNTLTPTHSYLLPGNFTVTLTITDSSGFSSSETLLVAVRSH